GVVARPADRPVTVSDRIDRVLTHRVWGTLVFLIVMLLMFQAVFFVAEPASAAIDWLNGLLGNAVTQLVPEGLLRSLLITGVIGAFLPRLTIGVGRLASPWLHGLVMFAMYSIGVIAAIGAAWVLKKTVLRGATPPFVMELPSYKMPGLWIVIHRMLEQGWAFV